MPERIGKYHILERIGRGGMGTIFKAHDPVLDRLVAVKVISSEIDVTDDLRARFFREAKACARLSHPNIVTVHDMGEDDGRLFLVMELLEGDELRRLILDRASLELEDKLSIMIQVCDGLSYAHQRGVIHRDIKPGNIIRLRGGQVKILDFGIAQIANDDRSLTLTGRIMGTLRYIAPEQLQGRADHRSDIFSVGAVFYELVSGRPPFTGDNPMQILEQIRTAHPLPLDRSDSTVPTPLAAAIDRAMQKDPAARFPDLAEMRGQLERVQRRLTEESESARARARAREQRDELVQLQQVLAERIGSSADVVPVPEIEERARLAVVRALGSDFASRIESVRARIARADALAPALARAAESLRAEHVMSAVAELERIVVDMPEHVRAVEMLRQARARAEDAERRRRVAAGLLQEARAALAEGGYALCLTLLGQVVAIPPPADTIQDMTSLREAAERQLAAQEGTRSGQPHAEEAREQMAQARRSARAWVAAQHAADTWRDAEARATEGRDAFTREAYEEAGRAFDDGTALYRQAEATVREAFRTLGLGGGVSQPDAPTAAGVESHDPVKASEETRASTPAVLGDAPGASSHASPDAITIVDASEHGASAAPTSSPAGLPAQGKVDRQATIWQRARDLWGHGTGRRRALVASGAVVALGGLISIVLGVIAWLPRPSPLTPPSAPPSMSVAAVPAPATSLPERSRPDQPPADAPKQATPIPTEQKQARAPVGSLVVSSKIAGVDVWLGDRKIGVTRPGRGLIASDLPLGTYRLKAAKAGHRDWEREVTVAADQRREVAIDIEPLEPAKIGKADDGAEMVLVPAGAFWMGSNRAEIDRAIEECKLTPLGQRCKEFLEREGPDHSVVLDGFYIDRFEVTNALFERFVRATGHQTTAERDGHGSVLKPGPVEYVKTEGAEWRKPNGIIAYVANHPVVQVNWHDADSYCRWAGKRLPTEAEWEKAARGTGRRIYPWGSSWDGSRLNASAAAVRTTTAVGGYPNGASPYGVHDMAGNVFEWVADWFDPTYYQRSPERNPSGPDFGTQGVVRGGSWGSVSRWVRVSYRAIRSRDSRSDTVGFRCAKGL